MTKLDIINVSDPFLKTVSAPIEQFDDDLRKLMDDMLETMYAAPGIGLAAIQVGVPKRLLVMDTEGTEENQKPFFMVNPEITWQSDESNLYNEGCLSVPEHYAEIERPESVKVKYLDYNGDQQEHLFSGLDATCVQHEIDHLNGIIFIDYLSKLKRNMIVKKVAKAHKNTIG